MFQKVQLSRVRSVECKRKEETGKNATSTTLYEQGYTGSLSTLNGMIAKERRNIKKLELKSYYFRQKIIRIIWNFKNDNHTGQFHKQHPQLLKEFRKLNYFWNKVCILLIIIEQGKFSYYE